MVRITAINSTFFQQTSNALSFRPLPLSLRQILPADSHYGKHLQSFSTSLMKTEVKTIGVVGAGVIGRSWISLALYNGIKVLASDPFLDASSLPSLLVPSWQSLEALKGPKRIPLENLEFVTDIFPRLKEVDFVQENGPEKIEYKNEIFRLLDLHSRPEIVLASSSSGLPSSQFISKCTIDPTRILIGHPFNPPCLIPTVEIVPHSTTSTEAVDQAFKFYRDVLGKEPVKINSELPGFVANRLQAALVHEAYSLVSRGIVSAEDIDSIVSNSLALRWAKQGPFLTKVLGGGGGGIKGYIHHLDHVGAAARVWTEDMNRHQYVSNDENNKVLISSVEKELDAMGVEKVFGLESSRDEFLVGLLKLKEELK